MSSRTTGQRASFVGVIGRQRVVLALLGALALLSRFAAIDRKSVWIDEAVSWSFANTSLLSMFNQTAHDKHPPFYYGVLHYWVDVFGNSEAALRAPSAIAGAATIVLLAAIGWRIGGALLACSAAILLTLNASHLAASQEARMYALAGLLALAASASLASYIVKPSIPRFIAYASVMTALIYTHYSGFMVVGLHALIFAGYGLREVGAEKKGWILAAGVGTAAVLGLAYIPWLSTFREHLASGSPYTIPDPSLAFVRTVSRSLVGLNEAKGLWLLFCLPLLGFGAYGVAGRWRDPFVACTAAIALVPVAQIAVSVWQTPVFNVRQAAPYTPGLAFVMALGLYEIVSRLRQTPRLRTVGYAVVAAFGVAVLVVMAVGIEQTYKRPSRQDWRSVSTDIGETDQPIYIAPGFQWQSLAYYHGNTPNIVPLWQADLSRIAAGGDAVAPDKRQTNGVLVVQGNGDVVIPAFKRYFDVEGLKIYRGDKEQQGSTITTYNLHPLVGPPG